MSLRVCFDRTPGRTLAYSLQRVGDGLFFDFADSTFKANPTTLVSALTALAVPAVFTGRYVATLASTPPATFPNGEYIASCHDTSASNALVGDGAVLLLYNGSDAPVFPSGAGSDPWGVDLSVYTAGQAGYLLDRIAELVEAMPDPAAGMVLAVPAPTATTFTLAGTLLKPIGNLYKDSYIRWSLGPLEGSRVKILGNTAGLAFTTAVMPQPPGAGDWGEIF